MAEVERKVAEKKERGTKAREASEAKITQKRVLKVIRAQVNGCVLAGTVL